MSETKHTPGPWTVDKRGVVAHELRRGGFMRRVALTESAVLHRRKETSANAHLIAAAPDLYQALAFAVSCIKSGEPWTAECERIIGAALAKARGLA